MGSDQELLDRFQNDFDPKEHVCSCGSENCHLVRTSSYTRCIITVRNNERAEHTVEILRLHFACGHSHAVIPDFLIPYASYTLRFILHVLKAYSGRTCSVSSFCNGWQISVSTLYDWIHRFCDHYRFWAGLAASAVIPVSRAADHFLGADRFPVRKGERTTSFTFPENKRYPSVSPAAAP